MTERIRKQWEDLGAHDPYWAVLTHPDKKGGRWDKEEFFQTGVAEIDELERKLAKLGLAPARRAALDYGCGVGRLTRALSTRFERVTGVDISQAMLDEARRNTAASGNVTLVRGSGSDLQAVPDASIDLVYSNIALQHSPAEFQRGVIRDMCRVVAPGGVIAFQTAAEANLRDVRGLLHLSLGNRVLNVARRIVYGKRSVMEFHTVPKDEVIRILTDGGMTVVSTERYGSAGEAFVGYLYIATRPAVPTPAWSKHPSAIVDEGAVIGNGTKVWHFCHVSSGARIGASSTLGQNVFVSSTAVIGERVRIQNNVSVYDGVVLDDDVFVGPSAVFTNVINPRSEVSRKHEYKPTRVHKGASIGANATIVCGATLGSYCFVGAGAVVTTDVKPFALVVGVPARQIGWMCRCGERLELTSGESACGACARRYRLVADRLEES